MTSKNYEWYVNADLGEYVGKWVVIAGEKVVASGRDANEVYRRAKETCPDKKLSIAKIPSGEMLILYNRTI